MTSNAERRVARCRAHARRAAPLLALLALAASCAPGARAAAPQQQGWIALSVSANSTFLPPLRRLLLRRLDGKGAPVAALERVAPDHGQDTALFAGALPAGEYALVGLQDGAGVLRVALADNALNRLGTLRVAPRQPADLGRLVLTAMNERTVFGRSAHALSNLALLRRLAPALAPRFAPALAPRRAGDAASGWSAPRPATDNVEDYALVRPVGARCPSMLADGRLVVASGLGSVLQRSPQGHWRVLHASTIESLNCLLALDWPDTTLVAVGAHGSFQRLPAGAATLLPADPGDLPPGDLLSIGGSAAAGWYLLHRNGARLTIYHSAALFGGHWQALHVDQEGAQAQPWTWRSATGMGYARASGAIVQLDFASGVCITRMAPERLAGIAARPDGGLAALGERSGNAYLAGAGAHDWQTLAAPPAALRGPPQASATALLAAAGGMLYTSADQGGHWQQLGQFADDSSLLAVPGGPLLEVHAGRSGLFYLRASGDGGATWRTEYSNFDRQALEDEGNGAK
ncbi:MAG: hypothetical protein V4582_05435 [Pseudomonadota bacterium]